MEKTGLNKLNTEKNVGSNEYVKKVDRKARRINKSIDDKNVNKPNDVQNASKSIHIHIPNQYENVDES